MIDEGTGPHPADASGMPVDDAVRELLAPFVELLPVTGASVSVTAAPGHSALGATDSVAARLEQLQFELGEGPHWDALRSGAPALVPDVADGRSSWPIFASAAAELEVGGLFAFPLSIGAVTIGVVDLYRSSTGALSRNDVVAARSLAAVASGIALRLAARSANADEPVAGTAAPELRRVVHQATGMLLVQLDVTATEAFAALRAHAFATGTPLESVAQDVVARRLTLGDSNGS